jgi:hypothetical protein
MVDSLQIFENLKSSSMPEPQARAMAQAIQKAESDIALDVKSVLESALRAIDQRFEAFEKRMDERMDTFEKRMDERMDAFEKRMDARFDTFEKRMDERMDRKFAEMKWQMLRWNVALWLAQLAAVAGIVKMLK